MRLILKYFIYPSVSKTLSRKHVTSILKITNELFYVLPLYLALKIQCIFYISSPSPFGLATFQVPNSHTCLVAPTVDGTAVDFKEGEHDR